MIKKRTSLLILTVYFFLKSANAYADSLVIQTWNMQWLAIAPSSMGVTRHDPDWLALRSFFHQQTPDILFFQEVDSAQALQKVVPSTYTLLFSDRSLSLKRQHQFSDINQYTGIALAPGIHYTNPTDFSLPATTSKSSQYYSKLRWATYVIVYPKQGKPIHLLSVHLKSGCSTTKRAKSTKACRELSSQAAHLALWIGQRIEHNERFIIGGDFNYLLAAANNPIWQRISANHPQDVVLATRDIKADCQVRSKRNAKRLIHYRRLIDHFITSRDIVLQQVAQRTYAESDVKQFQLSDHCPVIATITR